MTEEKQPSPRNEYRRYRKVLFGTYGLVAGVGFVWITASVLVGAFRPELASANKGAVPALESPAACQERVEKLFQSLSRTTSNLLLAPAKDEQWTETQTSSEWEAFTDQWQIDWSDTRRRCGFGDLSGSRVAMSKMALVHEDLPAMRRKYESLLARFEDQQAAELAQMRSALDRSRMSLESGGTK